MIAEVLIGSALESTLGYVMGFIIGLIMGLIGGGASLLLPVMVYLLSKEIDLATAYTLILGGVTATFGVIPRLRSGSVDYSTALSLGVPILLATLFVRGWLVEAIPDEWFTIGPFTVTKKMFTLLLFASVLLLSFASMMGLIGKNVKPNPDLRKNKPSVYFGTLIGAGVFIGVLSALIGAGGGVMMVPLLVLLYGLPMNTIVGTVLLIVSVKSVIGFSGDMYQRYDDIEWSFLAGFAATMVAGVLTGSFIASRMKNDQLKTFFAWFILFLAIFIIVKEIFLPETG
ncbi:MAG: sulfite exporter TauE/SafE family protein [Planctomycetota bacterium]